MSDLVHIEDDIAIPASQVVRNPNDDWFIEELKPYYIVTADGQYLFACTQAGRRPDRAFYMVPEGYKLGVGQKSFDKSIGKRLYRVVKDWVEGTRTGPRPQGGTVCWSHARYSTTPWAQPGAGAASGWP